MVLTPTALRPIAGCLILTAFYNLGSKVQPPAPYGAVPSERQLKWHEMEVNAFLHFTTNTFTDKEWGYGNEDPSTFAPTEFDADRIVRELKAGGMRGVILTAKHHDGFCLWPTRTTEHSVKSSKWHGGNGDVIGDLANAARRHGLKFGVYLSPWDRNNPKYGTPEYVGIYREQLRELLTNYGPIFEVWHDGANGGDGHYGGARETRSIDRRHYYDWPATWEMVRQLQPNAVIFSDIGPDIRWVGNESGYAAETSWATYSPVGEDGGPPAPGYTRYREAPQGHRKGRSWLPAECDVSIRPGWFWHAAENNLVKSPQQLFDLYFKSVGRGGNLLLNVPPDRRGLLDPRDAASIAEFGRLVAETFQTNLAAGAACTASNIRGGDRRFGPERLLDADRYSYWSTDDSVTTPEVVFDLKDWKTFDVVRLRENIKLGQRIEGFAVDIWQDSAWREIASGTSIGACRLLRLSKPITSNRLRLRITRSPVCPALSDFGLFLAQGYPAANQHPQN